MRPEHEHEGHWEATGAGGGAQVSRAKVQLHEIRGLLGEARRLIAEGGSDSERAGYLQRKGDLLDRLADDGHGVRGGESR